MMNEIDNKRLDVTSSNYLYIYNLVFWKNKKAIRLELCSKTKSSNEQIFISIYLFEFSKFTNFVLL